MGVNSPAIIININIMDETTQTCSTCNNTPCTCGGAQATGPCPTCGNEPCTCTPAEAPAA